MSNLFCFIAGMVVMYLIFKGCQFWHTYQVNRLKYMPYSKALKRSLKSFDPFSPLH